MSYLFIYKNFQNILMSKPEREEAGPRRPPLFFHHGPTMFTLDLVCILFGNHRSNLANSLFVNWTICGWIFLKDFKANKYLIYGFELKKNDNNNRLFYFVFVQFLFWLQYLIRQILHLMLKNIKLLSFCFIRKYSSIVWRKFFFNKNTL